jgi:hypothetical protein
MSVYVGMDVHRKRSQVAGGTATMASHPSPWPPGSLIFHRFGLTGALSAGMPAATE